MKTGIAIGAICALLLASAGIVSAQGFMGKYNETQAGEAALGMRTHFMDCENKEDCAQNFDSEDMRNKMQARSEGRMLQREEIMNATLLGDWNLFIELREEYNITEGFIGVMTESVFPEFVELANLQEEARALASDMASEFGLEMPQKRAGFAPGRKMGKFKRYVRETIV